MERAVLPMLPPGSAEAWASEGVSGMRRALLRLRGAHPSAGGSAWGGGTGMMRERVPEEREEEEEEGRGAAGVFWKRGGLNLMRVSFVVFAAWR